MAITNKLFKTKIRGAVSMTPIVTNQGYSFGHATTGFHEKASPNTDNIDMIHNTIKTTLGGQLNFDSTVTNWEGFGTDNIKTQAVWYYCPDLIIKETTGASYLFDNSNLFAKSAGVWNQNNIATSAQYLTPYDPLDTNMDDYVFANNDSHMCLYLSVTHTGLDEDGVATVEPLHISLGAGATADSEGVWIEKNESWQGKFFHYGMKGKVPVDYGCHANHIRCDIYNAGTVCIKIAALFDWTTSF